MKSIAVVSASVGLLLLFGSFSHLSSGDSDVIDRITADLSIRGPIEEGTEGKCTGNIHFGNCLEYQERSYVTHPDKLHVMEAKQEAGASKGEIEYSFDCHMKKKSFVPKGSSHAKSMHHKSSGVVKADYVYALDTLTLSNIRKEGAGGRCGSAIVDRMDDHS